nr:MAG TPA: hypothetical protein [Caudoviricetes sp.]
MTWVGATGTLWGMRFLVGLTASLGMTGLRNDI